MPDAVDMTSISRRITTPFGFHSTAAEVVADVDLSGKRAIVTGAASGIGVETARALAGAGADVTLAVREPEGRRRHRSGDRRQHRKSGRARRRARAHQSAIDLPVRRELRGPLHILVNNAGVMASPEARTDDGWELHFATNHLGRFTLAVGLQPALARFRGSARIVAVSASGHLRSPVVFDDMNFRFRPYDPLLAYGQSKTAVVSFAVEATARWNEDGIQANALNPGAVPDRPPAARRGEGQDPTRVAEKPPAGRGDIRPVGGVTAA